MLYVFLFFKEKTEYEMRISDWSSDVCSSDLFQAVGSGLGNDARVLASQHEDRAEHDFAAVLGGRARSQFRADRNLRDIGHTDRHTTAIRDHDIAEIAFVGGLSGNKIGRASCRERVWQYV